MKKLLTILLIFFACNAYTQTWKEWTQQKKTQLKYLAEQIAALQTYTSYVEKGYKIAQNGLDVIQNIKKGDFSMHTSYFNSLMKVNTKIKKYWKVADIIALQIKIIRCYHGDVRFIKNSDQFTPGESSYIHKVFKQVLGGCSEVIDQLILIIKDGNVAMRDEERIRRIDGLHSDIKDKYEFVQHFGNEIKVLSVQRFVDNNDIQAGKALWNIGQ